MAGRPGQAARQASMQCIGTAGSQPLLWDFTKWNEGAWESVGDTSHRSPRGRVALRLRPASNFQTRRLRRAPAAPPRLDDTAATGSHADASRARPRPRPRPRRSPRPCSRLAPSTGSSEGRRTICTSNQIRTSSGPTWPSGTGEGGREGEGLLRVLQDEDELVPAGPGRTKPQEGTGRDGILQPALQRAACYPCGRALTADHRDPIPSGPPALRPPGSWYTTAKTTVQS